MEILLWIVIVALFALSILGVFLPVLPDTVLLWAGFLLYHFLLADPGAGLPASFWWGMVGLSVLLFGADLITNLFFVKKYGGSKWSSLAAVAGIVLGLFLFPPFGMLLLPFLLVLGVEIGVEKKTLDGALKVALGTLVAFLSSSVMKVVIQLGMISWFFLVVW
ncbi:MAG: DUF456 family protein [Brevibacillus sp.]|nr:DUF456 family protein [Brevibacillus sp.]